VSAGRPDRLDYLDCLDCLDCKPHTPAEGEMDR